MSGVDQIQNSKEIFKTDQECNTIRGMIYFEYYLERTTHSREYYIINIQYRA